MEEPVEKTSYTLNHNELDESDAKKPSESFALLEEDIPMLEKTPEEKAKGKSTEILVEPNEKTALTDEKKETIKDVTQTNLPTKNRFLRLFDRKPNKNEPTEQNGNGVNQPETEGGVPAPTKRRFIPAIKIQNPFASKKNENDVSAVVVNEEESVEKEKTAAIDESPLVEGEEKKDPEVSEEKKTETKFKPLASINFKESFSGIINKFRKSPKQQEDIEMGNGPRGKAGLASMETLDDSTKDPWNQENGSDAVDAEKSEAPEKGAEDTEKKESLIASIQNYNCSIDDIALIAGIIVFILLVALILAFTFFGNTKTTHVAPIRDGKVLAVTSCGMVEGLVEDSAVAFRGIPYAKPPILDLRFEAAELIDNKDYCWNGTLKAHNATSECLQLVKGEIQGTEDCLTLDIITPEVRYINLLPVVVMIGTNDYLGGSPGILRPSARYSRSKDVVFVRPKFRLNVLGFLALEALSNSSAVPTSGNFALSDIIASLEWIQINIEHFGGDKTSVTLFGHRTGATLVTALTGSTKASKLFKQAWASSPSAHFPGGQLSDYERANADYGNSFGPSCGDKTCWKKLESQSLLEKIPTSWKKDYSVTLPSVGEVKGHEFLVVDGVILKKHVQDSWKKDGKLASKLVIGTTAHVAYDPLKPGIFNLNMTAEEIRKYVSDSEIGANNLTEEVLNMYGETVQGLIAMISDIRTVCPLFALSKSQNNIPFYVATQTQGDLNVADVNSDVQAILGRYSSETPAKRRYLDAIRNEFFYFISHGKINHYSFQNSVLVIDQDVLPNSDLPKCNFWIDKNFVPKYAAI